MFPIHFSFCNYQGAITPHRMYIYMSVPRYRDLQQTFIPPRMHRIPFRTAKLNEVGVTEYYGG